MELYKKRIDELGRVVIPKSIRNKLGIIQDDYVEMNCVNGKIEISKDKGLQETNKLEAMVKLLKKVYDYDVVLCNNVEIKISTLTNVSYNQLNEAEPILIKEQRYLVKRFVINVDSKIEGYLYILSMKSLSDDDQGVIKRIIDYFVTK